MEIIDELEPTGRSVYTGNIGYLSFSGDMDLNIVIRTILVKGQKAYFQVGGAIVYDSDPEAEYVETLDKARALTQALSLSPEETVDLFTQRHLTQKPIGPPDVAAAALWLASDDAAFITGAELVVDGGFTAT